MSEELKEIKNKDIAELNKILKEERETLRDLRFKDANRQLNNVRKIRKTRKTIARILTIIKAKEKDGK